MNVKDKIMKMSDFVPGKKYFFDGEVGRNSYRCVGFDSLSRAIMEENQNNYFPVFDSSLKLWSEFKEPLKGTVTVVMWTSKFNNLNRASFASLEDAKNWVKGCHKNLKVLAIKEIEWAEGEGLEK